MVVIARHGDGTHVTRVNPATADHDRNLHLLGRHAVEPELQVLRFGRVRRVGTHRFVGGDRHATRAIEGGKRHQTFSEKAGLRNRKASVVRILQ